MKNGVDYTNSTLWALRLNKDAHPLAYMIDGDPLTTWVSRSDMYMPGGLTLIIDLINGEYEVSGWIIESYRCLFANLTIGVRQRNFGGTQATSFFCNCDNFSQPRLNHLCDERQAVHAGLCQITKSHCYYWNAIINSRLLHVNLPFFAKVLLCIFIIHNSLLSYLKK